MSPVKSIYRLVGVLVDRKNALLHLGNQRKLDIPPTHKNTFVWKAAFTAAKGDLRRGRLWLLWLYY